MTIQIMSIDETVLLKMQNVLSNSTGYEISIQDEIDYFEPDQAKNWFLAIDKNENQLGFIRCFEINSDWSLGEFFINSSLNDREEIGELLLQNFSKSSFFPKGHKLRFDISFNDQDLNTLLMEKGFSHKKQNFKYFEMNLTKISDNNDNRISHENLDARQVAEVLSNLTPADSSEVEGWIKNDQVRCVYVDGNVVAAAQVYFSEDTLEIVRFATHPNYLRQGHAEKLINNISKERFHSEKKKIHLKVDSEKKPAIQLYKKMGFIEIEEKAQCWHSSWF